MFSIFWKILPSSQKKSTTYFKGATPPRRMNRATIRSICMNPIGLEVCMKVSFWRSDQNWLRSGRSNKRGWTFYDRKNALSGQSSTKMARFQQYWKNENFQILRWMGWSDRSQISLTDHLAHILKNAGDVVYKLHFMRESIRWGNLASVGSPHWGKYLPREASWADWGR